MAAEVMVRTYQGRNQADSAELYAKGAVTLMVTYERRVDTSESRG